MIKEKIKKIWKKAWLFFLISSFFLYPAFPACHPFDIKCRTVEDALHHYPLSSLQMKGSIEKNRTVSAIIQAPDHHVYTADLHARIGQEDGEIIAITDQKITVQQGSRVFFMPLFLQGLSK